MLSMHSNGEYPIMTMVVLPKLQPNTWEHRWPCGKKTMIRQLKSARIYSEMEQCTLWCPKQGMYSTVRTCVPPKFYGLISSLKIWVEAEPVPHWWDTVPQLLPLPVPRLIRIVHLKLPKEDMDGDVFIQTPICSVCMIKKKTIVIKIFSSILFTIMTKVNLIMDRKSLKIYMVRRQVIWKDCTRCQRNTLTNGPMRHSQTEQPVSKTWLFIA